jgi:hypothetical protein
MTYQGIDIKHPKQRGEWAELCFMKRAAEHGLCVTKPWGETARYDFAIEHDGHFVRVQVKATKYKRANSFCCNLRACQKPYYANEIDFVAAYCIQADLWYIIPIHAVGGHKNVNLAPHRKNSKHILYREAWHLLRAKPAKSRAASAGR